MKKIQTLLLALLVVATISSCKKKKDDETLAPTQDQYGFAINYTATWCGYCGSWGADAIHDLHDVDAAKVVAICAHDGGDPMHINSLFGTFSAQNQRYTGGGIPSFWVGDTKTHSNGAMTNLLAQTPIAGMDMKSSKKNGKVKVDAQVKFFDAGTGEYYLSILLLEDGIPGGNGTGSYEQNGTSNANYEHDYVLRGSHVSSNSYGELIATDPASGKVINVSGEITYDSSWDDIYPVLLLWHKNANGFYEFVNAFK